MAFAVADRVCETTTTTGTGTITLAGAITGYRTFTSALTDGDTVFYLIEAVDTNGNPTGSWEAGDGIFSTSGPTLTRAVVSASSTGSAVSFAAGTKRVHLAATATQLKFRGALAKQSGSDVTSDYTTAAAITWNSESIDTNSFHSTSVNTSRLTIPGDAQMVRASGQLTLAGVASDELVTLSIRQNGSASYVGIGLSTFSTPTTTPTYQVSTAPIDLGYGGAVNAGYFELFLLVASSTSVSITRATSWFAVEVLD